MKFIILTTVCVCLLMAFQVNSSCESGTNCQCKDNVLRKSECARVYFKKGCNSDYLDFRGEKEYFTDSMKTYYVKDKLSSIIVRPGCQLEIFEEEDYEGNSEIVSGFVEDWENSKIFHSYNCSCVEGFIPSITPKKVRPTSYPPMISVPNTHEEIMTLLNETNRHLGLLRALESCKNKRSPKNAYILVLGLAGAGKSSTINVLFDNPNIAIVEGGDVIGIDEYRVPVPVDELGINNSELRIIDTPGLGDFRGLENDAKILATLNDYLNGHEELSKYVPNVVLIFGKFNDNRFRGDGASFVKMLRAIDLFRDRLTDKKFSNVVFVLTHYMSERMSLTRQPTRKLAEIKKTIEDFSLFPKPITIVVAENRALDHDQPMLNGYFQLPNGDFYPKNLFDKIQQSTIYGSDPIGEAVIRTAFENADDFNITTTHFSLIESQHEKVGEYLRILFGRTNPTIDYTEVSRALATAFESLSPDLKKKFPDALPYLQRFFNIRNIHLKSNIPRTTIDIVKFLKEIRQNEATMFLMQEAFGLKIPALDEALNLMVSYGYNIIQHAVLPTTPFNFSSKTISDIGYMVPSILTFKLENNTNNFYKVYLSKTAANSVVSLHSSNIQVYSPTKSLKLVVNSDCNIVDLTNFTTTAADVHSLRVFREYRVFELALNNQFEFNEEFVAVVKRLPIYKGNYYGQSEVWRIFFARFGTHVVKSAHGGGSIEIQFNYEDPISFDALFNIGFLEGVRIGQLNPLSLNTNKTNYTLKFTGGDSKYHVTNFNNMNINDASQLLQNWTESLTYYPAILESHMELMPITEVVNQIDRNISHQIERAALDLFNISLYPQSPQANLPPARESIKIPTKEINCKLINFG